jgi:uncharacterized membrane protein
MAKIYANLVMAGRRSRSDIASASMAEQVGKILLDRGYITQDEYDATWATVGDK